MSNRTGIDAIDHHTVTDALWEKDAPHNVRPARIYFSRRKLETAIRLANVTKGSKVLDIGCHNGVLSFPMQRLGLDVTAVDIDEEVIMGANNLVKTRGDDKIVFEVADAGSLSEYHDGQFDHVFSFQTFRYFENLNAALRQVSRVLKPGGSAVIDFPHRYSPFFFLYKKLKGHKYRFPDHNYMTAREAVRRFENVGFRSVSTEVFLFTPPTTPKALLPIMKRVDSLFEGVPGVNILGGILMVKGIK